MNTYWIWFSRINKIGAITQNKLLQKYKSPENIWNLTEKELIENDFLNKKNIDIILSNEFRKNLKAYEAYITKNSQKVQHIPTNYFKISIFQTVKGLSFCS